MAVAFITGAAITLMPAGSFAQHDERWSPVLYDTMGIGSAACTPEDDQGDSFCFGLRCEAGGGAPEWFTYQVGSDSPDGEVQTTLIIDGQKHRTIAMRQLSGQRGTWEFVSPLGDDSAPLVSDLKSGSGFYVLMSGAAGTALTLNGSSAELDRVLAECARGSGETAMSASTQTGAGNDGVEGSIDLTLDELPAPVRAARSEIIAMCGGQEPRGDASPILADDIDGDGSYDFLLNHAAFCPSQILMMCGASNCPYTLLVSDGGSWQRYDYILQGYESFTAEGFLLSCANGSKAGVFVEGGELVQRNC